MEKTKVFKDTLGLTKEILLLTANGFSVAVEGVQRRDSFLLADYLSEYIENRDNSRIQTAIKRLEKQKFIKWRTRNGKIIVTLEEKGKQKILSYKLEEMKLKRPKKWDGLFRVIIFDIPEKNKTARENLRRKLKELEFYKLQKSVFVSPFECKDEIDFLCQIYGVDSHVQYILAKEIPGITIKYWMVNI